MEELKPCPFCGGEIQHDGIDWNDIFDYGGREGLYYCVKCGLKAKFPYDTHMTVARAMKSEELWNTRYEPTCHNTNDKYSRNWNCSLCGHSFVVSAADEYPFDYCPGCGAKMVD